MSVIVEHPSTGGDALLRPVDAEGSRPGGLLPTAPLWTGLAASSASRAVLLGLVSGIAAGLVYRGFMALLTPTPTFTLAGTSLIVGSVTLVAVLVAVVARARVARPGQSSTGLLRVLAGVSFLLLANAQGALLLPVWVLGGLGLGRVRARPALRVVAVLVAALLTVGFVGYGWIQREALGLGVVALLAASLAYPVIALVHVAAFSVVVGSSPGPVQQEPAPA